MILEMNMGESKPEPKPDKNASPYETWPKRQAFHSKPHPT